MPQTTLLYSKEAMKNALQDVKNGVPVRTAAKRYCVPKTTLLYKSKGVLPEEARKGPGTILTTEEENILEKWLLFIGDKGFPATKTQLLDSVELIIKTTKRKTPFVKERPGRKWYNCFMKRHPNISVRISQNLTSARSAVSEDKIRQWFVEIQNYLQQEHLQDIWQNPNRIFNADETAFFLSPKGERVLFRKGDKTIYNHITGDEKENLTTLINVNAAGMIVPPMVVFKYERIPPHISSLMPPTFGIAKSDSGWMTGPTFYEYVTNIFYPWLIRYKIEFPVVLFVDGHKSHMTLTLSNFCLEKKIILIALFPNSTHILQPLDVAVFKPLKSGWKNEVKTWKIENNGVRFKKEHFGNVLKKAVESSVSKEAITNGFRSTGLYPLDPNAINYGKYFKNIEQIATKSADTENVLFRKKCLEYVEETIDQGTLTQFREIKDNEWNGQIEDTSLFKVWKKLLTIDGPGTSNQLLTQSNNPTIALQDITNNINKSPINDIPYIAESIISSEEVDINNEQIENTLESVSKHTSDEVLNKTPPSTSDTLSSSIPFEVPTPFKKCLFWPEPQKDAKPKRIKDKIPYVTISQDWRNYHLKKQMEKERKEAEKEERKRKREELKTTKLETKNTKNVKRKILDDTSSDSSIDVDLQSEDEEHNWEENEEREENREQIQKDIEIGSFIIVKYNESLYPGKVTGLQESQVLVSVMAASSTGSGINHWKWQMPKDEMWYLNEDIHAIIDEPILLNKRGIYKVPEIEKYSSFLNM